MSDSIKKQISSTQGIAQVIRDLNQMLDEHGFLTVEIKRGHRTVSQNALYWMWLTDIANYLNKHNGTDFVSDEIHLRMKHDFLGYEPEKRVGSAVIPAQLKSTKSLTKGEMHHYLRQIDQWAAGVGLLLPRPEDSQYEQLRQMQSR